MQGESCVDPSPFYKRANILFILPARANMWVRESVPSVGLPWLPVTVFYGAGLIISSPQRNTSCSQTGRMIEQCHGSHEITQSGF